MNWIGPDETSILAVPRYACEQLVNTWETEAVDASPAYVRKCIDHGIPQPVGMCFQDLGWASHPRVAGPAVRYVTWQEYLLRIARVPPKDWHFTMEDIRTTSPWGEKTLQKVAQQSRSAETRLLMAEKLAAMAYVLCGAAWPGDALDRAWEQVMWSQFHDSWITATTKSGREAWAFQVAAETLDAENSTNDMLQQAAQSASQGLNNHPVHPIGMQWLRAFNTLGFDRADLLECTVSFDRHTQDVQVLDERGNEVPSQWSAVRRYQPDASGPPSARNPEAAPSPELNAVNLLIRARVPAVGFTTLQIKPLAERRSPVVGPIRVIRDADGNTVVENEFYSIRFDPRRGGAITSFEEKDGGRQLCASDGTNLFNEYRGYFIAQKRWRSSAEDAATIEVVEAGPLRALLRINGSIGECPVSTLVNLQSGDPRVEFDVTFQFDKETWIGDPWDIQPNERMTEQRRSSNDGRWKLQALFPTRFAQTSLDKNGGFDVCRSRNTDTYFQRWDEIKHNIILNWVDVRDDASDAGLALFSEHTTAYTHGPDHPLSLVLGWGWEGGFWWGKCPLIGEQRCRYAVMPHRGDWQQANLWQHAERHAEPLFPMLIDGKTLVDSPNRSLIKVSGDGVQLSSMRHEGRALEVRLFNARTTTSHCQLTCIFRATHAHVVDLKGSIESTMAVRPTSSVNSR